MSDRNFRELLAAQCAQGKYVCLGLDSRYADLPDIVKANKDSAWHPQFLFNASLIDVTRHVIGVCKFNLHFYLSQGPEGFEALINSVQYINSTAPEIPVILDYKTGDVENTNEEIAEVAYDVVGADAATFHNYTGKTAMLPILRRRDKGAIILCRTSNPGSGEFQNVYLGGDGRPTYTWQHVAASVRDMWNEFGNCGMVFGATYLAELTEGRDMVGDDMPLLIPGAQVQGGSINETVRAGIRRQGTLATVNSSRGLIFPQIEEGEDFTRATARAAEAMHLEIKSALALAA